MKGALVDKESAKHPSHVSGAFGLSPFHVPSASISLSHLRGHQTAMPLHDDAAIEEADDDTILTTDSHPAPTPRSGDEPEECPSPPRFPRRP